MNILVVGGSGFLGANLVRRCLLDPSNEVTVLDSLEPRLCATTEPLAGVWDRIRFIRGSMNDESVVAQAVQEKEVIFNCAAQTSHPLSLRDPLFDAEINCLGNLRLLEAVRLLNPQAVVVYTSSSTVIGRAADEIVDETHAERPLDIYSANKGVAEKYYRIYNRVHDLRTVTLRFANLYGPHGKGFPEFGFVNYFIHLAWKGEEIRIFGRGDQTRNVLFVEDAVDALLLASREPRLVGEVFFVAHEEHHTVAEIAGAVVAMVRRGSVTHVDWPEERRRIEIERVRIRSDRFREITGWAPRFGLEAGLLKTRETLEANG
jgi:UDP-glucose 4-epimerase